MDNTTTNATRSPQVAALNKTVTPVWKLSQHQPRSSSSAVIPQSVWKKIKPLKDVGDIKLVSTKFQEFGVHSNTDKHSPITPVSTIIALILVLVKKKEDWTKTVKAQKLLHHIFFSFSKTSPEVFIGDWKRNGDIHPSSAASLWTAGIKVLDCSFNLKVQINLTAKDILKNDVKDLKVGGKKLTFDPGCISIRTKTGCSLPGKITRQPFAKRLCVPKQFSRKHQTYIKVTICGNMHRFRKYDHFVKYFREMLLALMIFEPSLVVILYPGGATSNKGCPFENECSTICSSYKCQIYIDNLSIGNGTPTTVKLFVGHDMSSDIFNSLELAQKADDLEGAVRVCFIQASKVVVADFLDGSTKTMNMTHWTEHYNCLPPMGSMDNEGKMLNIEDSNGEPQTWSPRNRVMAAHILCSKKMRRMSIFKWVIHTAK